MMIDFKYNVLCEMFIQPLLVSIRKMIEICNRCGVVFANPTLIKLMMLSFMELFSHINIINIHIIC